MEHIVGRDCELLLRRLTDRGYPGRLSFALSPRSAQTTHGPHAFACPREAVVIGMAAFAYSVHAPLWGDVRGITESLRFTGRTVVSDAAKPGVRTQPVGR